MARKRIKSYFGSIKYVGKKRARLYVPTPKELARWRQAEGRDYRWTNAHLSHLAPSIYLHEIRPRDFLNRAAYGTWVMRRKEDEWLPNYRQVEKVLKEDLGIDPLTLWIDKHTCNATAHEGRHRASIAYAQGIRRMPIILVCDRAESWKECEQCYKDFPSKIGPQGLAHHRDSRHFEKEPISSTRPRR